MKYTYKDIECSQREFKLEVPPQKIKDSLELAYKQIAKDASAPGFRKGKVPKDILEAKYGKDAQERVLSDLLGESYREALLETKTAPVGMPKISDVDFKIENGLFFKAVVDIRPKVNIKSCKDIKAKKGKMAIKDEDVEQYLTTIRESYAQFKSIEGRASKLGDYITCDISCESEGKPVYDEQKNILLSLDKKHSMPELVEGLTGANKGDVKTVKAKFPENKDNAEFSNKEAVYTVKVHEVKEKELPKLDDEFAKSLGTYKTLNELKDAAKKDLEHKGSNKIKGEMSNQILDHLINSSKFDAPKGLVEEEVERLTEEVKENMRRKHVKDEDIQSKDAEIKKNVVKETEKRVKLYFLLDEVGRAENITVSTAELDMSLEMMAKQSNMDKEKVKEYYVKNQMLNNLRNQLRENKIMEFLLKNADIVEEK